MKHLDKYDNVFKDLSESLSGNHFTFQLFSVSIFKKMAIACNDFIIIIRFMKR